MKKIIILIIWAVFMASCSNDYLERMPSTQVGESQDFFNTASGLEIYSNSFYNYIEYTSITEDMSSDNCENSTSPADIRLANYVLPTALGSGGWNWTQLRNINYFIDRCMASIVSDEVKMEYIALAKYFRAQFYYNKIKTFGDVPWYSHPLGTNEDDQLFKGRDSRILVMDSVLNDLNDAVNYLPEKKYRNRISKYAALALKSRICLYEGTWRKYHKEKAYPDAERFLTEAANAAKELMDKKIYSLYSTGDVKNDFRNLFLAPSVSLDEVILAYSFASGKYHAYTCFYTIPSRGTYGATRSLISDFGMDDGRSFYEAYPDKAVRDKMLFRQEMQNRDPRLTQSIVYPGYVRTGTTIVNACADFTQTRTGYQITKRVGAPSEDDAGDARDVIIIRYAEVLLNYAEAKAELGTLTQEDVDLTINMLRKRAGLPGRSLPFKTDDSQREMYRNTTDENVMEVRRERRIELAFEGFRKQDIIRWAEGHLFRSTYEGIYVEGLNQPIDMNNDGKPDVYFYNGEAPVDKIENVIYIGLQAKNGLSEDTEGRFIPYKNALPAFRDWEYVNPIPSEELTLNKNLEQNAGWDQL
ncbi:RagB/SusD family nutrient uptake outer membrane protein [Parabacteroides chongii]|uniref:RagB/SusD family nutrient uptake outer membrane protein n=1 Tax=Parabacteroides chongii TaxID=2685834 RepID=UPI00240D364C|nr:RagB/SusD family nutrient uptake outer membrane protein [Parabacteroides chongii]WFE82804.1 RagB/SusD family nutrient uptake outer membrane protein [Parabacteroides chongii]